MLVLDGASNRVIKTIDIPARMVGWAWNWTQNRLYVECEPGGKLAVIRDSGGYAVEEPKATSTENPAALTTIVRGVLNLQSATSNLQSEIVLLDISGRKVLDLRAGASNVSRLAPGVYFVRLASGEERGTSSICKVIVTR
jgi:hypothetical protein